MKRLVSLILVFGIALCLSACDREKENSYSSGDGSHLVESAPENSGSAADGTAAESRTFTEGGASEHTTAAVKEEPEESKKSTGTSTEGKTLITRTAKKTTGRPADTDRTTTEEKTTTKKTEKQTKTTTPIHIVTTTERTVASTTATTATSTTTKEETATQSETKAPPATSATTTAPASASLLLEGNIEQQRLSVGDRMYDITVTDSTGATIRLSEMLKEKKMVVLNFWFATCFWCEQEFPVMNEVYEAYKDTVGVLALNPLESEEAVKAFRKSHADLTMPMAACPNSWARVFGVAGYPSSVVIDRNGIVCMIDSGAILDESEWEALFDHFIADGYETDLLETGLSDLFS